MIVFQPLSEAAMVQIATEQVRARQRQWQQRWEQSLQVDERVVEWIGRRAHVRNEQANGREGGRIVHKLLATTVDSALANAKIGRRCDSARTVHVEGVEIPDHRESGEVRVQVVTR